MKHKAVAGYRVDIKVYATMHRSELQFSIPEHVLVDNFLRCGLHSFNMGMTETEFDDFYECMRKQADIKLLGTEKLVHNNPVIK